MRASITAAVAAGLLAPGCDDEGTPFGFPETSIALTASVLVPEPLEAVCYSFAVVNGATPAVLVAGRGPSAATSFPQLKEDERLTVCSDTPSIAGASHDFSLALPCDATTGREAHKVRLWVDALCRAPVTNTAGVPRVDDGDPGAICGQLVDYNNPCGDEGCELEVTCQGGKTTPVTFNLTPTEIAHQGFFDIGISFEDLPGVVDVCYSLAITNAKGELVLGLGPGGAQVPTIPGSTNDRTVCASQMGNSGGGDLSYVSPCDGKSPAHEIRYWVDAVCAAPVTDKVGTPSWSGTPSTICEEVAGYVNPCGAEGCVVDATCVEDFDTPITISVDTTPVPRAN